MRIITLLTDFGLQDGYVGIMKGVMLGIAPHTQLVDLSHEIAPQNILAGMLTLERSAAFFPAGTIHLAVVDPGVGSMRRPLAARVGEHFFVGPDNGLISPLLKSALLQGLPVEMVTLDQPRFWLANVSPVFHGRDIFAPSAAHLANGVPLSEMGTPIKDVVQLEIPVPQQIKPGHWKGQVIHIDHFGNLSINIRLSHLLSIDAVEIQIAGNKVQGLKRTFSDAPANHLIALIDSDGYLSICLVNGNAARQLNVQIGDAVEVMI